MPPRKRLIKKGKNKRCKLKVVFHCGKFFFLLIGVKKFVLYILETKWIKFNFEKLNFFKPITFYNKLLFHFVFKFILGLNSLLKNV